MLLSKETTIHISDEYSTILSHMNYTASKLWNICNYERRNYKTLGLEKFPDWYYQKKYHKENLWFTALPYKKIYTMLEYKLTREGIRFIKVKEAYSSQCGPLSEKVDKSHAVKSSRKYRGLYQEGKCIWNADSVGSFNILLLYFTKENKVVNFTPRYLSNPIKVAV